MIVEDLQFRETFGQIKTQWIKMELPSKFNAFFSISRMFAHTMKIWILSVKIACDRRARRSELPFSEVHTRCAMPIRARGPRSPAVQPFGNIPCRLGHCKKRESHSAEMKHQSYNRHSYLGGVGGSVEIRPRSLKIERTLKNSSSVVWTPMFATRYSLESS